MSLYYVIHPFNKEKYSLLLSFHNIYIIFYYTIIQPLFFNYVMIKNVKKIIIYYFTKCKLTYLLESQHKTKLQNYPISIIRTIPKSSSIILINRSKLFGLVTTDEKTPERQRQIKSLDSSRVNTILDFGVG